MRESERRRRNNKIRRNRQLRQRFLLGAFTFCMILVLSMSVGGTFTKAQEETPEIIYKCFESILIESGDTLTSIAQEYIGYDDNLVSEYIDEVVSINHLESEDDITAGEYIVVPCYSTSSYIN